jgi:hypothetical protein
MFRMLNGPKTLKLLLQVNVFAKKLWKIFKTLFFLFYIFSLMHKSVNRLGKNPYDVAEAVISEHML